jgi:hypothetical protein
MRLPVIACSFVIAGIVLSSCEGSPVRPDLRLPTPVTSTPVPVSSQMVTGLVKDAVTGEPITDAAIEWTGLAEAWGDRGHGVKTDANGHYQLPVGQLGGPGSAQGTFLIRASKAGYISVELNATLTEHTEVNFNLEHRNAARCVYRTCFRNTSDAARLATISSPFARTMTSRRSS